MATTSATAPATYPTKGKASSRPTGWLPFFLGTKGPTGYGSTSTTEEVAANWNGEGKVVIITGATLPSAFLLIFSSFSVGIKRLKSIEVCCGAGRAAL